MPSISDTLAIADVSCYLANDDIAKGALFGKRLNPKLPVIIYMIKKVLRKVYEADNTYTGLQKIADYLYFLCQPYAQRAIFIINGGSSGQIAGTTVGVFGINWMLITSGMFANATDYEDERLKNKEYRLYWAEIDDYFLDSQWEYLPDGGFRILVDGFDSATMDSKGIYLDFKGQGIPLSISGGGDDVFYGDI